MINTNIQDWSRNPVVTSIDTTAAPNSEVDFPAITACEEMPRKHQSWEVPMLVFDMIDFLNCSSDECDESVFKVTKWGFKDFVEKLADKYLEGEIWYQVDKYGGPGCPSECGSSSTFSGFSSITALFEFIDECEAKCDRVPVPGGFRLPEGYNGVTHTELYFNVAYCELAKRVDNTQEIKSRWVDSITSSVYFSVEILAEEFGAEYDFESSTLESESGKSWCELDENQEDIMKLLSKIYLGDTDVIFEKLGSTLRLHVEFGRLNIQPYSNGYATISDSSYWVSCSISCGI